MNKQQREDIISELLGHLEAVQDSYTNLSELAETNGLCDDLARNLNNLHAQKMRILDALTFQREELERLENREANVLELKPETFLKYFYRTS